MKKPKKKRRFKHGTDDLEQLEGIENQQQRSREARERPEDVESEDQPRCLPPLINRVDKSKRRVQNRLDRVTNYEDVLREFGSYG